MKALESAFHSPVLWETLAPLAGVIVNMLAQIFIGRLPLSLGQVRRQFISFGCGLFVTVGWLGFTIPYAELTVSDLAARAALQLMTYGMIGFIFFNVINSNISSLRVRMLKEFLQAFPDPLPDQVLRQKYRTDAMLDARLERLLNGGQIAHRNGRYYFQPSAVAAIGRFFAFLQNFLLRKG